MRNELQKLEGKKLLYKARFAEIRSKTRGREKAVLLTEVYQGQELVADHVWVEYGPDFMVLKPQLSKGVMLQFWAVAKPYLKDPTFRETGLERKQELDTGLTEITDVSIV